MGVGIHTEGSPITGDKFLRHGARACKKYFRPPYLFQNKIGFLFTSWHNHDFHINTFIQHILVHVVKQVHKISGKCLKKNTKISLKNIFSIPLYHFQSQFSIMGLRDAILQYHTLSMMCILGLSEDLTGLALDIFKMGSWDPSTFGKWGPLWKIGVPKILW